MSDIALLMEIATVVLVLVGFMLARHRNSVRHGTVMATAVTLHTILILLVMGPSLLGSLTLMKNISNAGIIITWAHVLAGMIADILGLYLVAAWRFRRPPKMDCARRTAIMKPLIVMWMLSLVLGILFYAYYYL